MKHTFPFLIVIFLLGFKTDNNFVGKFYNHCSFHKKEYFDFKTENRFEYFAECEYKIFGQGKYIIKDSLIILSFLKFQSKEKGHFETLTSKSIENIADSIYIKILDSKNDSLLSDASIVFENTRIGFLTGKNGETKIPRINNDLKIYAIGYNSINISKELIINNEINGFNVYLQDGLTYFKENVIDTVSFKVIDKDSIEINNCLYLKDKVPSHIIICE